MTDQPSTSDDHQIVQRCSSLPTWLGCELRMATGTIPEAFRQHGYELGPYRANVGALMGSGVHGGGEYALTELMVRGKAPPLSATEDAAIEEFHRRKAEEADARELVMTGEAPDIATAEKQVRRMTSQLYVDVITEAEPIAVESRLEAIYRDGDETAPAVILSGKADLLHLDRRSVDQRATNVLRDTKTSRRRRPAGVHMAQQGGYKALFSSRGLAVDQGQIDFLLVTKIQLAQARVEMQPIDIDAAEITAYRVIEEASNKMILFYRTGDPSIFLPNPDYYLCNPKFCRAHGRSVCSATRDL